MIEMNIDGTLYPDLSDPPRELTTDCDRADYLARVCGAWDFEIIPTPETFALFAGWREIFDRFPLPHSPAYAAFRSLYGWPRIPGGRIARAHYELVDDKPDPCVQEW